MVRCCSCIQAIRCCCARLQRFRRHRVSAAGHRQADVLVRHPERRQRAVHVLQAGLQDQVELVRLARRGLGRGHLQHQRQVALAHVEIALARTRAWSAAPARGAGIRGPAAPAGACTAAGAPRCARPDRRTSRLTTPSSSTCSPRMANEYTALSASWRTMPGNSCGSVEGVGDRLLARLRAHRRDPSHPTPTATLPRAVVHQHPLQARHEHPQQAAVGLEGSRRRVRLRRRIGLMSSTGGRS